MRLTFLDFAPQPLQIVELALICGEDVHDHVAQIDQNPRALIVPLDARDFVAFAFGALDDRVGNRTRLNFRAPGDQCKSICENRASADVDRGKVFALAIERGVADDFDQFSDGETPSIAKPNFLAAANVCGAAGSPCRSKYPNDCAIVARIAAVKSEHAKRHSSSRSAYLRPGSSPSARYSTQSSGDI